jgi:sugar phosphate isomerase/epimerase
MAHPLHHLDLPFRIGATSYIIEDDLVANAHYLAARLQDMQLILFDLQEASNLPDAQTIDALVEIGRSHGLSYTVHLVQDLGPWVGEGELHPALRKAQKVIGLTRALQPYAYVVHLDGGAVRQVTTPIVMAHWQDGCARALAQTAVWAGDASLLAVENLEGYPPDLINGPVRKASASRCVDIGHLWLEGHDPVHVLSASLPETRVIHLHGIQLHEMQLHGLSGSDHQSLAQMSPAQLDPVVDLLLKAPYRGVVTLEVFSTSEMESSLDALLESIARCRAKGQTARGV